MPRLSGLEMRFCGVDALGERFFYRGCRKRFNSLKMSALCALDEPDLQGWARGETREKARECDKNYRFRLLKL